MNALQIIVSIGFILWTNFGSAQLGNELFLSYSSFELQKLDIDDCNELQIVNSAFWSDIAITPDGTIYGIDFENLFMIDFVTGGGVYICNITSGGYSVNSLVAVNNSTLLTVRNDGAIFRISVTGIVTYIGNINMTPAGDITYYKGWYYVLTAFPSRLVRFKISTSIDNIYDFEIIGNVNTLYNEPWGLVTVGNVDCFSDDLQMIVLEGYTVYQINPNDASTSVLCDSIHWSGAVTGACSFAETNFQTSFSDVKFPNIITPNYDGVNDVFEPLSLTNVQSYSVAIYNRWGNLIFFSDASMHWDGLNSDGKQVSDGTYFYLITYNTYCDTQSDIHGFVTVIR